MNLQNSPTSNTSNVQKKIKPHKKGIVEFEGTVTDLLPGGKFKVKIVQNSHEHEIVAYISGKMRKNKIRILAGDTVTVEISLKYDKDKGRIIKRGQYVF